MRDPIKLEGDSIVYREVPFDSYVHILNGNRDDLISAASQAYDMSHLDESSLKLCFDCISRALFMAEEFKEELEKFQEVTKILWCPIYR